MRSGSWACGFIVGMVAMGGCAVPAGRRPVGVARPDAAADAFHGVLMRDPDSQVYFGGQPDPRGLREVAERRVDLVVNLRTDAEMAQLEFDEAAASRRLGVDYVQIPITGESFSTADADRLDDVLDRARGDVLIHCASANRVGALWALYLHRHRGFNIEAALERGRAAGLRSEALAAKVRQLADE